MILKPPFIPVYRFQPEVAACYTQGDINTGYVSLRSVQHVDKFVRDCKEAGIWSKLAFVMPFIGASLSGATAPLREIITLTTATAVNFVDADYSEATGLTGNGSTKYLNLNFNANALAATGHIAFYQRNDDVQTGNRWMMGANDGTTQFILGALAGGGPSNRTDGSWGAGVSATAATQITRGFYMLQRVSTTDLKIYRNNTQIATSAVNTAHTTPNQNFYAWARNNTGVAADFNNCTGSFLSIGAQLSTQERADYYAIVQTLQINLGRAV